MNEKNIIGSSTESEAAPPLRSSLLRLSVPARFAFAAGAALLVWTAVLLALA